MAFLLLLLLAPAGPQAPVAPSGRASAAALEERVADAGSPLEARFFALEELAVRDGPVSLPALLTLKGRVRGPWLADFVRCLGRAGADGVARSRVYLHRRYGDEVRAEAVFALGAYGEEGESFARSVLRDRAWPEPCRVAALAALARRGSPFARVEALRRLAIEDGALLLEALEVLRAEPALEDAPYLIDLLEEKPGRPASEAVRLLQEITGYRAGKDPRAWKYWMIKHRSEGTPFRREPRPGEEPPNTLSYLGIPVLGDRVVFVLDSSGSMQEILRESRGESRGVRAVEELVRLLPALPATAAFDLVFFDSGVSAFSRRLVPKTAASVARATGWLRANRFEGATNVYGGLEAALEREGVEEIILLSDGMPTSGEITDTARILARIARLNRFRMVRINTISLGAPPAARNFLCRLARDHGGICRVIG